MGDATSHGGRVETGAPASSAMDRAVARKGDRCSCPVPGHQDCTIAEGDAAFIVDGRPAFDGHRTSCSAVLIAATDRSGTP
uniref:Conserved hypothethical protein, PAAR motif n=1 Tax=blood disease bacterium R229 TaxID=741978 RepID=G2ZRS2_9RALS|nr:conserved hypothethical protein, PAAR motif [blood disease bacterium R229]